MAKKKESEQTFDIEGYSIILKGGKLFSEDKELDIFVQGGVKQFTLPSGKYIPFTQLKAEVNKE